MDLHGTLLQVALLRQFVMPQYTACIGVTRRTAQITRHRPKAFGSVSALGEETRLVVIDSLPFAASGMLRLVVRAGMKMLCMERLDGPRTGCSLLFGVVVDAHSTRRELVNESVFLGLVRLLEDRVKVVEHSGTGILPPTIWRYLFMDVIHGPYHHLAVVNTWGVTDDEPCT